MGDFVEVWPTERFDRQIKSDSRILRTIPQPKPEMSSDPSELITGVYPAILRDSYKLAFAGDHFDIFGEGKIIFQEQKGSIFIYPLTSWMDWFESHALTLPISQRDAFRRMASHQAHRGTLGKQGKTHIPYSLREALTMGLEGEYEFVGRGSHLEMRLKDSRPRRHRTPWMRQESEDMKALLKTTESTRTRSLDPRNRVKISEVVPAPTTAQTLWIQAIPRVGIQVILNRAEWIKQLQEKLEVTPTEIEILRYVYRLTHDRKGRIIVRRVVQDQTSLEWGTQIALRHTKNRLLITPNEQNQPGDHTADILSPWAPKEFASLKEKLIYYAKVILKEQSFFLLGGYVLLPILFSVFGYSPELSKIISITWAYPAFLFSHTIARWKRWKNTLDWRGWPTELASDIKSSRHIAIVLFNLLLLSSSSPFVSLFLSSSLHFTYDFMFSGPIKNLKLNKFFKRDRSNPVIRSLDPKETSWKMKFTFLIVAALVAGIYNHLLRETGLELIAQLPHALLHAFWWELLGANVIEIQINPQYGLVSDFISKISGGYFITATFWTNGDKVTNIAMMLPEWMPNPIKHDTGIEALIFNFASLGNSLIPLLTDVALGTVLFKLGFHYRNIWLNGFGLYKFYFTLNVFLYSFLGDRSDFSEAGTLMTGAISGIIPQSVEILPIPTAIAGIFIGGIGYFFGHRIANAITKPSQKKDVNEIGGIMIWLRDWIYDALMYLQSKIFIQTKPIDRYAYNIAYKRYISFFTEHGLSFIAAFLTVGLLTFSISDSFDMALRASSVAMWPIFWFGHTSRVAKLFNSRAPPENKKYAAVIAIINLALPLILSLPLFFGSFNAIPLFFLFIPPFIPHILINWNTPADAEERFYQSLYANRINLIDRYLVKETWDKREEPGVEIDIDRLRGIVNNDVNNNEQWLTNRFASIQFKYLIYYRVLELYGRNRNKKFLMIAGGTGSGKTTYLESPTARRGHSILVQATLAFREAAEMDIRMSLNAGFGATLRYIYRDPVEAYEAGVINRVLAHPRGANLIPIKRHVHSHIGGLRSLLWFIENQDRFGPNFKVEVLINSGERREFSSVTLNKFTEIARTISMNRAQLTARLQEVVNGYEQDGRITTEMARAFRGEPSAFITSSHAAQWYQSSERESVRNFIKNLYVPWIETLVFFVIPILVLWWYFVMAIVRGPRSPPTSLNPFEEFTEALSTLSQNLAPNFVDAHKVDGEPTFFFGNDTTPTTVSEKSPDSIKFQETAKTFSAGFQSVIKEALSSHLQMFLLPLRLFFPTFLSAQLHMHHNKNTDATTPNAFGLQTSVFSLEKREFSSQIISQVRPLKRGPLSQGKRKSSSPQIRRLVYFASSVVLVGGIMFFTPWAMTALEAAGMQPSSAPEGTSFMDFLMNLIEPLQNLALYNTTLVFLGSGAMIILTFAIREELSSIIRGETDNLVSRDLKYIIMLFFIINISIIIGNVIFLFNDYSLEYTIRRLDLMTLLLVLELVFFAFIPKLFPLSYKRRAPRQHKAKEQRIIKGKLKALFARLKINTRLTADMDIYDGITSIAKFIPKDSKIEEDIIDLLSEVAQKSQSIYLRISAIKTLGELSDRMTDSQTAKLIELGKSMLVDENSDVIRNYVTKYLLKKITPPKGGIWQWYANWRYGDRSTLQEADRLALTEYATQKAWWDENLISGAVGAIIGLGVLIGTGGNVQSALYWGHAFTWGTFLMGHAPDLGRAPPANFGIAALFSLTMFLMPLPAPVTYILSFPAHKFLNRFLNQPNLAARAVQLKWLSLILQPYFTHQDLLRAVKRFREIKMSRWRASLPELIGHVKPFIQSVQRSVVVLAISSGSGEDIINMYLEQKSLLETEEQTAYFDGGIYDEKTPKPVAIQTVAGATQGQEGVVVMIGDAPADLSAARKVPGTVFICRCASTEVPGADYYITDYSPEYIELDSKTGMLRLGQNKPFKVRAILMDFDETIVENEKLRQKTFTQLAHEILGRNPNSSDLPKIDALVRKARRKSDGLSGIENIREMFRVLGDHDPAAFNRYVQAPQGHYKDRLYVLDQRSRPHQMTSVRFVRADQLSPAENLQIRSSVEEWTELQVLNRLQLYNLSQALTIPEESPHLSQYYLVISDDGELQGFYDSGNITTPVPVIESAPWNQAEYIQPGENPKFRGVGEEILTARFVSLLGNTLEHTFTMRINSPIYAKFLSDDLGHAIRPESMPSFTRQDLKRVIRYQQNRVRDYIDEHGADSTIQTSGRVTMASKLRFRLRVFKESFLKNKNIWLFGTPIFATALLAIFLLSGAFKGEARTSTIPDLMHTTLQSLETLQNPALNLNAAPQESISTEREKLVQADDEMFISLLPIQQDYLLNKIRPPLNVDQDYVAQSIRAAVSARLMMGEKLKDHENIIDIGKDAQAANATDVAFDVLDFTDPSERNFNVLAARVLASPKIRIRAVLTVKGANLEVIEARFAEALVSQGAENVTEILALTGFVQQRYHLTFDGETPYIDRGRLYKQLVTKYGAEGFTMQILTSNYTKFVGGEEQYIVIIQLVSKTQMVVMRGSLAENMKLAEFLIQQQ